MRRTYATILVFLGAFAMLASAADAKKRQWAIGASQIVISDGITHVYVLSWQVPSSLGDLRVDHATIEFYVDADDNADDEHFQIRLVPATDVSTQEKTYTLDEDRMVTFVDSGPGQNRRVVLDVTPVVRYCVREGETAYCAILGEGVTDRAAALSTGNLGGGAVAKLTVWASRR